MSDIYINATKLETKLREKYVAAIACENVDAIRLCEDLIDILKSQARFQRIDVMDRCVIGDTDLAGIPENVAIDFAKDKLSHDLGEHAVKNEYAKITSHRSPLFHNSLVLELYASFLIPEQPEQQSMISVIGDDEDAAD